PSDSTAPPSRAWLPARVQPTSVRKPELYTAPPSPRKPDTVGPVEPPLRGRFSKVSAPGAGPRNRGSAARPSPRRGVWRGPQERVGGADGGEGGGDEQGRRPEFVVGRAAQGDGAAGQGGVEDDGVRVGGGVGGGQGGAEGAGAGVGQAGDGVDGGGGAVFQAGGTAEARARQARAPGGGGHPCRSR